MTEHRATDLSPRFVSEAETRHAMSIASACGIVRETYAGMATGGAQLSSPSAMSISGPPHRLGAKGAVLTDEDIAGVRLTSRTHPRLLLWRLSSGEPIALVDESWLYRFRTGVSAAVVADLLFQEARPDTVALIGAGPIAWEMALALHCLVAPRRLRVAARRAESARGFARRAEQAEVPAEAADSVAEAVRDAALIVTITSSDRPFLHAGDLRDDAVVLSMGGAPECAFDIWQTAGTRYVDELGYALSRGDAGGWIAEGRIDAAGIEAGLSGTVADLAATRIVPGGATEGRILAIVQGVAALDIALASEVLRNLEREPVR